MNRNNKVTQLFLLFFTMCFNKLLEKGLHTNSKYKNYIQPVGGPWKYPRDRPSLNYALFRVPVARRFFRGQTDKIRLLL